MDKIDNIIDDNNFVYFLSYINDHICKIFITNKKNSSWDYDLTFIFKNKDNEELISIGSSNVYYKIIDIYTNIKIDMNYKLASINNNSGNLKSILILENDFIKYNNYLIEYSNLIGNNIGLSYIYFNNYDKRLFIKKEFDSYLKLYDITKNIDFKNIIFAILYLYKHGGYYISNNIILNKKISELDCNNNDFIFMNNNSVIELLFSNKGKHDLLEYLDYIDLNYGVMNNFKTIEYHHFTMKNQINIDKHNYKYGNSMNVNNIKFFIDSKMLYNIEYLEHNYYLLNRLSCNDYIEEGIELNYIIDYNESFKMEKIIISHKCKKKFVFKLNLIDKVINH
jgi:hypothetical protein